MNIYVYQHFNRFILYSDIRTILDIFLSKVISPGCRTQGLQTPICQRRPLLCELYPSGIHMLTPSTQDVTVFGERTSEEIKLK